MITEAVISVFVTIINALLNGLVSTIGIAPSAYIGIPSMLNEMIAPMIGSILTAFPFALAWWVWRQVKA